MSSLSAMASEFDGVDLKATINGHGWEYVCRTAKNAQLTAEGERLSCAELGIWPGECADLPDVTFTLRDYGPVLVVAWWEIGYKEPLYLVTNMDLAEEACYWCSKRYRIETFFSAQKSRGFKSGQKVSGSELVHSIPQARKRSNSAEACL